MDSNRVLSAELQKVVESRMDSTLKGVEETLERILERQAIQLEDLKEILKGLEESFSLLSQKWSLQILYTLFLNEGLGFGKLKSILGVNSRTLSDKLKILVRWRYVDRVVEQGPPVRVKYSLTARGHNTVLLALPLLYYSSNIWENKRFLE